MSTGQVAGRGSGTTPIPAPEVAALMRPATSTVERGAHLAAAAYLMKHHGDSALVVTTDDEDLRPIAVITDADISQAVADRRSMENTRISDLHLPSPVTVASDASAEDAVRLMVSRGVRNLPVVEHGRLVGMVEFSDVCLPLLGSRTSTSRGDGEERAESSDLGSRAPAEPVS